MNEDLSASTMEISEERTPSADWEVDASTARLVEPQTKASLSMQLFLVAAAVLLTLFVTLLCIGFLMRYEVESEVFSTRSVDYWKDSLVEEQAVWFARGIDELRVALGVPRASRQQKRKWARNAIVFVVAGVEPGALAAARWNGGANNSNQANDSNRANKSNLANDSNMVKNSTLANNSAMPKDSALPWERFAHLGRLQHHCPHRERCDPLRLSTALFGGVRLSSTWGGFGVEGPSNCSSAPQVRSIVSWAQAAGRRTGLVTTGRVTDAPMAALYAHVPDAGWECDADVRARALGCSDVAQQLIEGDTGRRLNVVMGGGRQTLVAQAPSRPMDPVDATACDARDGRNLVRDWQQRWRAVGKAHAVLLNREELRRMNGSGVDHVLGIFANDHLSSRFPHMPNLGEMVTAAKTVLAKPPGYLLVAHAGVHHDVDAAQLLREVGAVVAETVEQVKQEADDTLILVILTSPLGGRPGPDERPEDLIDTVVLDTVIHAQGPKAHLFQGVHDETYLMHALAFITQVGQFGTKEDAHPQGK